MYICIGNYGKSQNVNCFVFFHPIYFVHWITHICQFDMIIVQLKQVNQKTDEVDDCKLELHTQL